MKQIDGQPVATKGFDFVMFLAEDMARARAFYESLFGIHPGELESDYYVEYELPDGNTFALGRNPNAPHTPIGGVMFAVENASAAAERAAALGGKLVANFSGTHCATAWCTDPEGNVFGLHQRT